MIEKTKEKNPLLPSQEGNLRFSRGYFSWQGLKFMVLAAGLVVVDGFWLSLTKYFPWFQVPGLNTRMIQACRLELSTRTRQHRHSTAVGGERKRVKNLSIKAASFPAGICHESYAGSLSGDPASTGNLSMTDAPLFEDHFRFLMDRSFGAEARKD